MTAYKDAAFYDIKSSQADVHPRLIDRVRTHAEHDFQRPVRPAQSAYFHDLFSNITGPMVWDLGCGTGMSTDRLALRYPRHHVIGVDKSLARLQRHHGDATRSALPPSGLGCLCRADAMDLIAHAVRHGLRADAVYLLYPNPWPKPKHLQRRWHGHALFPSLLSLTGRVEMRTNWKIYANEFAMACRLLGWRVEEQIKVIEEPLSLFEAKYQAAGVVVYQVVALP